MTYIAVESELTTSIYEVVSEPEDVGCFEECYRPVFRVKTGNVATPEGRWHIAFADELLDNLNRI